MTDTPQEKRPIHKRPPSFPGKVPFEDDLLARQPLADRLTGLVERLNEGAVFGITGDWGDGKSWFGRNWQLDLQGKGFRTFFVDAFEQDFSDDAFLVIASEIIRGVGTDKATETKLLEASKQVAAAFLPVAGKMALSATIRFATGMSGEKLVDNLGDKIADATGTAAEKFIEKRLKGHEETMKGVQHFRETLKSYCAQQTKPVVFFIDELDRCKPPFAVQVVERIKHFFDVDNLVFVLLLNRTQLEASINGVYGTSVNAADYLNKFVHFFLRLPTRSSERLLKHFALNVAKRYGHPHTDQLNEFVTVVVTLAQRINLSLRDIERVFVLLGLAPQRLSDNLWLAAYVIVLKLKRPDLFDAMRGGSITAYGKSQELISNSLPVDFFYTEPLKLLHRFFMDPNTKPAGVQLESHAWLVQMSHRRNLGTTIPWMLSLFDLPSPE